MTVDQQTHKFLGRVLDGYGRSIGTCFQVSPGVIITAAHVVRDVGGQDAGQRISGRPDCQHCSFGIDG